MKYFLFFILILFYSCSHKLQPYVYNAEFPKDTNSYYIRKITGISKPVVITDSGTYFIVPKYTRIDKKLKRFEVKETKKRIKDETKYIKNKQLINIEQLKDSSKIELKNFKENLKEKNRLTVKEMFKVFIGLIMIICLLYLSKLLKRN
jgi:hypothetical protein